MRCGRLSRHLRDLGAGSREKGASQKPFDGDPYTRLATAELAKSYMGQGCVRFKARMTSRRQGSSPGAPTNKIKAFTDLVGGWQRLRRLGEI
jgi:hypothetical protein